MSDVGGAGDVQVSAVADEQALVQLSAAVEAAIAKGFAKGFAQLGRGFDLQAKNISASMEAALSKGFKAGFADLEKVINKVANGRGFKNLENAVKEAFTGGASKEFFSDLGDIDKRMLSLVGRLKQLDAAVSVQAATVATTGQQITKDMIAANTVLRAQADDTNRIAEAARKENRIRLNADLQKELVEIRQSGASKLAIERSNLDAIGREQKQAGALAVIEARQSGQVRVAAVRAALKATLALEQGLGTAISGVARTATAAVSRLFSTMKSTVTREVRETNNTFTTGLSTSLTERESILRDSFRDQERIIRTSVTRQEAQITRLRAATSTGVAGAVTGRGLGLGVGGLIAGVGVGSLLKAGFADSVALGEELNKNKIVFGQLESAVENFSRTSVNALALTQAEALNATGTFGNLFRAVNIGEEQSAAFSISLTTLATDLASFNNTSVDDALTALRSGLVGETEPLKRFGVNLNEATLKAKAMELGLSNGKGTLDANAKAQAAYALIMEQTTLAQGDFARTADEGANAQRRAGAAIRQFASDVAGSLKGAVTFISNVAVPAFQSLSNLVTGENLSAGMLAVRDAIKGVAIALAGILAVKTAVEVFQLLGVAISFALTPMGALILAAAAVGAALGVLLPRSEALRTALATGVEAVKGFAESARDFLVPILEKVASFVVDVGIPAFLRLADVVRDYLVKGFGIAARFITGTVVPALQTAFVATAGYITDTALPAIRQFIDYIGDEVAPKLLTAADAVGRFFLRVKDAVGTSGLAAIAAGLAGLALGGPIIAAAAAGLAYIGTKIAQSFDGFSNLPATALDVLKNIGSDILRLLEPARKAVVGFFKDLFSLSTLGSIGEGVLTVVEFVGRKLGELVSSKMFAQFVAAVAVAAVLVGASFLKGFAEGVINNAPETLRFIRDAIIDGLKLLLNPTVIGAVLLGAFALTQVLNPLINAFRKFGDDAGKSFKGAFTSRVQGANGFLQGVIGGPAGASLRNSENATKATNKDIQKTSNQLRIFGAPQLVDVGNLEAAKKKVAELGAGFSDAQQRGLVFRDRLSGAFKAISVTLSGAGGIAAGIGKIGGALTVAALTPFTSGNFKTNIAAGFSQIKTSFQDTMAGLKKIAAEQGTTVGKAFAAKLAAGAAIGFGGFIAGKAEGSSGGSGALSAVGAGLTGLAVGGPVVGAAAAGLALIGASFGRADAKAKAFRDKIKSIADGLEGELKTALEDGILTIGDFRDGLDFGDVKGLDTVREAFKDAFGDDGVAALAKFGVTFDRDVAPALRRGVENAGELRDAIIDAASSSDEFASIFGDKADEVASKIKDILKPGGRSSVDSLDISDIFGELDDAEFFPIKNAMDDLISLGGGATEAFNATRGALESLNNEAAVFDSALNVKPKPGTLFDSLFGVGPGFFDKFSAGLKDIVPQSIRDGFAANVLPGIGGGTSVPTPKIDSASLTNASAEVDKALGQLELQAQLTNQKIQNLFNPPAIGSSLFDQVDESILSLQGVGAQIQEQADIIASGVGGAAASAAQATKNQLEDLFGSEFSEVVQAGLASGLIVDEGSARDVTAKLLEAVLAGVPEGPVRDALIAAYDAAIAAIPPLVTEKNANDSAIAAQAAIQTYFTNNPIDPELATGTSFSDYASAAVAYFTANPITPGVEADTEAARVAAEALVSIMRQTLSGNSFARIAGNLVGDGYAEGMRARTSAVQAAAADLALASKTAIAAEMGIASPSKVTFGYGVNIAEGLVSGMNSQQDYLGFSAASLGNVIGTEISKALQESTDGISQVMTGIIDSVFASGTSAAMAKAPALFAGLSGAFGGLFGSGALAPLGLTTVGQGTQALSGLTTSFQGVLTGLESNASTLQQIADQLAEGLTPLSASQNNIFGESASSLNPFDILGVANLGQLTSAFDAIAAFGQVLLAQGNSPESVASSVNTYVQQLLDMATSVGFSADEVTQLAVSLGLSQEAMAGFVQSASAAAYAFDQAQFKAAQQAKAADDAANAQAALELAAEFTAAEFNALSAAAKTAALAAAGFTDSIDASTAAQMAILARMNATGSPTGPADPNSPSTGGGAFDPDRPFPNDPRNPQPGDTPSQVLAKLPRPVVHVYLPYGDPVAVGLAVVNKIVEDVRIG